MYYYLVHEKKREEFLLYERFVIYRGPLGSIACALENKKKGNLELLYLDIMEEIAQKTYPAILDDGMELPLLDNYELRQGGLNQIGGRGTYDFFFSSLLNEKKKKAFYQPIYSLGPSGNRSQIYCANNRYHIVPANRSLTGDYLDTLLWSYETELDVKIMHFLHFFEDVLIPTPDNWKKINRDTIINYLTTIGQLSSRDTATLASLLWCFEEADNYLYSHQLNGTFLNDNNIVSFEVQNAAKSDITYHLYSLFTAFDFDSESEICFRNEDIRQQIKRKLKNECQLTEDQFEIIDQLVKRGMPQIASLEVVFSEYLTVENHDLLFFYVLLTNRSDERPSTFYLSSFLNQTIATFIESLRRSHFQDDYPLKKRPSTNRFFAEWTNEELMRSFDTILEEALFYKFFSTEDFSAEAFSVDSRPTEFLHSDLYLYQSNRIGRLKRTILNVKEKHHIRTIQCTCGKIFLATSPRMCYCSKECAKINAKKAKGNLKVSNIILNNKKTAVSGLLRVQRDNVVEKLKKIAADENNLFYLLMNSRSKSDSQALSQYVDQYLYFVQQAYRCQIRTIHSNAVASYILGGDVTTQERFTVSEKKLKERRRRYFPLIIEDTIHEMPYIVSEADRESICFTKICPPDEVKKETPEKQPVSQAYSTIWETILNSKDLSDYIPLLSVPKTKEIEQTCVCEFEKLIASLYLGEGGKFSPELIICLFTFIYTNRQDGKSGLEDIFPEQLPIFDSFRRSLPLSNRQNTLFPSRLR